MSITVNYDGIREGSLNDLWQLAIQEGATHAARPSQNLFRCWRWIDEGNPELVQIVTFNFLNHWVMMNWGRDKFTDKIFEEEKEFIESMFEDD